MNWKILFVQFTLVLLFVGLLFLFFNRYHYQEAYYGELNYVVRINKLNNETCIAHIPYDFEDYIEDIGLEKCN